MGSANEVADFAESLRALKERSGRSYGSLATRLHVSTSTLHRYCNGDAVPADYAPVERFARMCGATPEELIALHRRWMLADAARHRAATRGGTPGRPGRTAGDAPGDAAGDTPGDTPDGTADDTQPAAPSAPVAPTPQPSSRSPEFVPRALRPARPEAGAGAGAGVRWTPVGSGSVARGRLRAVPAGEGAEPRRAWRRRPWALLAGAAAMVVLAVTAVQVRPPGDDKRKDTATSPRGTAHPRSAAPAGPTARGQLDRADTDDRKHRSGASPRAGKRDHDASASPSPGASSDRPGDAPGNGGSRAPLTLSTRSHIWENGCDHRYLIDRPPTDVAPPPTEQDAPGWASAHGAVHGGTTNVEVTVQGRASSAVVLQALHVRVVGRRDPLRWSSFAMDNGCGGSLTPRAFSVDLDASRPLARPTDGNDSGTPLPAVRFPYRVSATDPEVLRINARTSGCDCRWYLELDWSSGGREGTVRIDDRGVPFRTSGAKGRPEYGYDYGEGAWRKNG